VDFESSQRDHLPVNTYHITTMKSHTTQRIRISSKKEGIPSFREGYAPQDSFIWVGEGYRPLEIRAKKRKSVVPSHRVPP
jgi:hypothetical protein